MENRQNTQLQLFSHVNMVILTVCPCTRVGRIGNYADKSVLDALTRALRQLRYMTLEHDNMR